MKCPCCGQETDFASIDMLRWVLLSPGERRVMNILLDAHPRTLSQQRIADLIYANDPNGGPLCAVGVIANHTRRIRQKIGHLGWTVGGVGPRSGVGISRIIEPRRHNGKANLNVSVATLSA